MTSATPHRSELYQLRQHARDAPLDQARDQGRRRVLQAAGSMFVSNGLTIAIQILMVPLLIWSWGASLYGEWIILYTIPGYLSLSDFGIIATASNRIEAHSARRNFIAANRTYFNAILVLLGIIGLVSAGAAAAWVILGERFAGLFVTLTQAEVFRISAALFADAMVMLILNQQSALYRTLGKFNWTINWQAAGRVIPILGLCFAAAADAALFEAALVMLALRGIVFGVMVVNVRRRVVWLRRGWLRGNRSELAQLIRGTGALMVLPLSNIIYLHVTIIVVAAVSTPATVAAFATLRTFTRLIPQFVGIVGRARWSEIAAADARGEVRAIGAMRRRVLGQTVVLCAIAGFGYVLLGKTFYLWWTSEALIFDDLLFYAMLANSILIACYYSVEVFLLATNRVRGYARVFLAVTLVQIWAGYLLTGAFGVAAFPICAAIGAGVIFAYLTLRLMRNGA